MVRHKQPLQRAICLGAHQASMQAIGQGLVVAPHEEVDRPGIVNRQRRLHHQLGEGALLLGQLLPRLIHAAGKGIEAPAGQHGKQRFITWRRHHLKAVVLQQGQIGPMAAEAETKTPQLRQRPDGGELRLLLLADQQHPVTEQIAQNVEAHRTQLPLPLQRGGQRDHIDAPLLQQRQAALLRHSGKLRAELAAPLLGRLLQHQLQQRRAVGIAGILLKIADGAGCRPDGQTQRQPRDPQQEEVPYHLVPLRRPVLL